MKNENRSPERLEQQKIQDIKETDAILASISEEQSHIWRIKDREKEKLFQSLYIQAMQTAQELCANIEIEMEEHSAYIKLASPYLMMNQYTSQSSRDCLMTLFRSSDHLQIWLQNAMVQIRGDFELAKEYYR
jgi:transcriptional regulator with AAA-type ATPase domain